MASNALSGTKDLTKGSELRAILLFAIPLFMSNLLQQAYNLTDITIIGNSLGDDALTAIGTVSIIYDLFTSLSFGMSNGFAIVVSKYFGMGDQKKIRQVIANTAVLAVIWGVLMTVLGTTLLRPIMRLLGTPEEVFETGFSYAIIMLGFIIFSFTYNILSALLRAIGNSTAPFFFLLICVVGNIGLDLLFVVVFGMGLPGAAIATIIAQTVSAVVSFIYIWRRVPVLHFTREDLVFDRSMITELISAGISFALMFAVVNIGTVILQSAINSLGVVTIAAHTTARKISSLCMMVVGTLGNSMATFTGQNHGAGKYDRIRTALRKVLILDFIAATLLIIMIYAFGGLFVRLISGSSNPELISTATYYLRFDLPFYYVLSILLVVRCTLQGLGSKITPIAASLMELLLKALTAGVLVKYFGYTGIAMCEPIIWSVCAVYVLIVFFMNPHIKALRQNK
ncbi:putative efflux protein, MATE family [Ruminococcaceae bacterium YRB3002]|nr:putative efflux protein, MATE family [Ruminococcaceae bacterium YRB3002]